MNMKMTDKESGQNNTVPQLDKGTSPSLLLCKNVSHAYSPVLHILHNSSEGMFFCLPEELYILSAFFAQSCSYVL